MMMLMGLFLKKNKINIPKPARFVTMVHFDDMNDYPFICLQLEKKFGKIDFETLSCKIISPEKEQMHLLSESRNRNLRILSFQSLIGRDELVSIQTKILKIEKRFNTAKNKKITIRPGYVTDSVAIGAYLEDDFHRIYLFNGVYAQTWYKFEKMKFIPLKQTPLYMLQKSIITAFNDIRQILVIDS